MRLLTLLVLLSVAAIAQAPADVASMLKQAHAEIQAFEKAGGKKDDPKHPVEKWAAALWDVRQKTADPQAKAAATAEGIHLLVHAERFSEVYARAEQVAPEETAWESLPQYLLEAAKLQKDYSRFFSKLEFLLHAAPGRKSRAAIHLAQGRAWRDKNNPEQAKAAFQAAMQADSASTYARQAETELYELLNLGPGQPAPQFSTTALDGSRLSLDGYRGKPVVLVFWSTH